MLRAGKMPSATLPSYTGASSTTIASGGAYSVGYGYASDQNIYTSSGKSFSRQYDEAFNHKPNRISQPDSLNLILKLAKYPMAWAWASTALFFMLSFHYRGQVNSILRSVQARNSLEAIYMFNDGKARLEACRNDIKTAQAADYDRQNRVSSLERDVRRLEGEKAMAQRASSKNNEHIEALTARDYAWRDQVTILQNATQRESKRSATELFGPGPHHVKFTVILPSDEEEREQHFIIEMAPLDLMPHAVHFFLQQVVHGLWNDAWFYLNGPHVLQAGPQAPEDEEELWHLEHGGDDERAVAMKQFREASLETLAFPEYSDSYQHEKWTLGYTGRPGGPDFYINKLDNSKSHGPGGQFQHDLYEYGDPCFAKVVDGFDVLKQMIKEPTYPDESDWGWFFEEPVHIVHAKIMEDAPLKIEVVKEAENHSRKPEKPLMKHKLEHTVEP